MRESLKYMWTLLVPCSAIDGVFVHVYECRAVPPHRNMENARRVLEENKRVIQQLQDRNTQLVDRCRKAEDNAREAASLLESMLSKGGAPNSSSSVRSPAALSCWLLLVESGPLTIS